MTPASADHAAQLLRELDRDRYFATLVLGQRPRAALTALYAFSAEIATVPDRVRDPAAGEIRLRWWIDALGGAGHGEVRANPLAGALLDAIAEFGLPVPPLTRLVTARRFDLYQDPMPDIPTFEGYAGETVSALYQLGAMVLNGGRPVDAADAAGHLGVAHALIGHLRAFGFNASRGRIFLPWQVFAACGVNENDVLAGRAGEGLAVALTRISELATEHLAKARAGIRLLPRELRAVFAPITVLPLQQRLFDAGQPFAPPRDIADWRKIAHLVAWKARYA